MAMLADSLSTYIIGRALISGGSCTFDWLLLDASDWMAILRSIERTMSSLHKKEEEGGEMQENEEKKKSSAVQEAIPHDTEMEGVK